MPATANDFSAHRSGKALRVTGTVSAPSPRWVASLEVVSAAIDHDPAELRLALTASGQEDESGAPTDVAVDETFDVDHSLLTHVVISLVGDIEAPRYSGDSLNIPID